MATGKEVEENNVTSELRIPNYSQTRPNPTTIDHCYHAWTDYLKAYYLSDIVVIGIKKFEYSSMGDEH